MREMRNTDKIVFENVKGRNHLVDLGVDRRIISNGSYRNKMQDMGWILLAQDRVQWRALVDMVMNLRVP
jgi:hypothetical protein